MTLFQNSVLRNHLKNIDKEEAYKAFEIYKNEFLDIKVNIEILVKQIDTMVYALYDLTEDEVAVVEGRV